MYCMRAEGNAMFQCHGLACGPVYCCALLGQCTLCAPHAASCVLILLLAVIL
jgi:hypothetical protein